jgi:WD40 repeat protein
LPVDTSAMTALAPSPDGKTVALGFDDGTVRLFEPATLMELKRFGNQGRPVDILRFAPNGKQLATSHAGGEKDLNIDVWDLPSEKVTASFPGYLKSFDGKVVAAISSVASPRSWPTPPDTITLWNVATKSRVVEVKDAHRKLFAMTRDGAVAATMVYAPKGNAGQCRLKVWNVATGQERLPDAFQGRGNSPSFLKFSPDGKYLAMGDDNLDTTLPGAKERKFSRAGRLYDVATGKERTSFPLAWQKRDGAGHPENNWTLAEFSPDSKLLVTIASPGEAFRSKLSFWDVESGKETGALDNPAQLAFLHAVFSPDGKTLATVTQGRWRREGKTIRFEKPEINGSGHFGGSGGTIEMHPVCEIHLWDVATRQRRNRFVVAWYGWQLKDVCFAQDGQTLLTHVHHENAKIDRVQAWDVATGKERGSLGDRGSRFQAIGFAADGRLLAVTDQELNERLPDLYEPAHKIRFWDALSRKELAAPQVVTALDLPLHFDPRLLTVVPATPARGSDAHIRGSLTTVSADGNVEATVSGSSIKLVERRTGRVLHLLKSYKQHVTRMVFTPDGKTLAVGDHDGAIRLWHVATGRALMTLPGHPGQPAGVKDLAFRADGRVLASCSSTEIRLWQATTDDEATHRQP